MPSTLVPESSCWRAMTTSSAGCRRMQVFITK
jgi:hypothetical protein